MKSMFTAALMMVLSAGVNAAPDCSALNTQVAQADSTVPGCDAGREVIGNGRLQFYSAPDPGCKMPGIFIIAGQSVVAYSEYKGYTSVMYINKKTGEDTTGWVSTARLKRNGTGISPCQ